jgi:NTE family protein
VEFEKQFLRHRGITILQKRDPGLTPLRPGKVALVLAGGAISGGAYKVGGLRALDEVFASRKKAPFKLTDCDLFVGLSAGSVLASVLSAGIGPDEVLRILLGTSSTYEPFQPSEFMAPNWREPLQRIAPFLDREQDLLTGWLSGATDPDRAAPWSLARTARKMLGSLTRLMPTGLFTTDRLGAYLRRNMGRVGIPDDFVRHRARYGKGLYLTSVDINRGQMIVFGHDEPYAGVSVSDAVCASCALPGWYRPVRVKNPLHGLRSEPEHLDLVDGGLVRTANVRLAVEKGADLVICYNPFTRVAYQRAGRSLVGHGPMAVASQVFRILLGARLDLAKELLFRDESIDADVVFIEPAEDDLDFFAMNPLDYWSKERAAEHGYRSIRAAIAANYERLGALFATHGIELTPSDGEQRDGRATRIREHDLRESKGRNLAR